MALLGRLWRNPAPLLLVAFTTLSVLRFRGVWIDPNHRYVGGGGDPEQTMWFLTWVPHALGNHLNPLLSDHMNYPVGLNVMWNTSLPLAGLLLWPLTTLVGPMLSYNVVMTLCPALSAWCAYLAIRRYVPNHLAAAVGGLLYGFSPYMQAQLLGHANLVVAFLPPLIMIVLDDILIRQERPWWLTGICLGVLVTAQLLLGEELLAGTAIAAMVVVAVLVVQHRHRLRAQLPHAWRALGVGAGLSLLLSAWPLAVQFLGPERPRGPLQAHDVFVSDALSFVVPTFMQRLAPDWAQRISNSFTGNGSEWNSYLGLPLVLVLIFVVARHWRAPLVRTVAIGGLIVAVLSMGQHLHLGGHRSRLPLPWDLVDRLPVLGQALPNRLMLFVYLLAGVLLALFLHGLQPGRSWPRGLAAGVLTIVVLVPLVPIPAPITGTTATAAAVEVPPFFSPGGGVERLPERGSVLVLPFPTGPVSAPVLWQATSGISFRMLGGYWTGPVPEHSAVPTVRDVLVGLESSGAAPALDPPLPRWLLTELHRAEVRTVVAGPAAHHDLEVSFMTALLGRPPQTVGGVQVWFDVAP